MNLRSIDLDSQLLLCLPLIFISKCLTVPGIKHDAFEQHAKIISLPVGGPGALKE